MFEVIINPQIQYLLILQGFREFSNGVFDNFFLLITMLGENFVLLSLMSVVYWCINKKAGIFLFLNLAMSVILNLFIKLTACIHRPWIIDSRVCPIDEALPNADGYSFPSGHTARAIGVWGAMAYWWWDNKLIRYFSLLIVLLVGFSRNYIGVHTPQDVIVSLLFGVFLIYYIPKVMKWVEGAVNRDIMLFVFTLLIGIIIYIFLSIKCANQMLVYNPKIDVVNPLEMMHSEYGKLGFYFGVLSGWLIERRFVNFSFENLTLANKFFIAVLGLILLHLIPNFMGFLVGQMVPSYILSALIKFLTALFVLVFYPIFIKFLANR